MTPNMRVGGGIARRASRLNTPPGGQVGIHPCTQTYAYRPSLVGA